jgi:hypothetical protein
MTSYKLFLPIESLVSDILAGDGNIEEHFYGVHCTYRQHLELRLKRKCLYLILENVTYLSFSFRKIGQIHCE